MLVNIIAFLIAISVLVAVHEYGHFWVARRCGVFVERFSIGFGPVIWRCKDKLGTEYALSAIPLGGYVKMLGEQEPVPEQADASGAYQTKSVWARMAIVLAGPIANFLFAIFLFWLMLLIGIVGLRPIVDSVQENSIAAQALIQPNTEILEVAGQRTPTWEAVSYALVEHYGDHTVPLRVKDNNTDIVMQKQLNTALWELDADDRSPLEGLGIVPKVAHYTLEVAQVVSGAAADNAGLQVGDNILAVNNQTLSSWQNLVKIIQSYPNESISLLINRQGRDVVVILTPEAREQAGSVIGYAGLSPVVTPLEPSFYHTVQYGPLEAWPVALEKTWSLMVLTVSMIGKLFQGIVPLESLSGPITIAQGAGASASYGVVTFLSFLALLSVNLGVINLLPLPVLDGGAFVFLVLEALRGKPLSERTQEAMLRVGLFCILALMTLALFNDVARL